MTGFDKPPALFVYGSLAPDGRNAHILAGLRGRWLKAELPGELRKFKQGPERGYLALKLSDDWERSVTGKLFCCRALSQHWRRLDAFEGPHYRRSKIVARLCEPYAELARGELLEAQVYLLNAPLSWTRPHR